MNFIIYNPLIIGPRAGGRGRGRKKKDNKIHIFSNL